MSTHYQALGLANSNISLEGSWASMNEDPYPQGVQTILDRQIDGTLPVQDPDSTPAKTFPNLLKGFVFKPDDETYYLNPDEQYAAVASKAPVAGEIGRAHV